MIKDIQLNFQKTSLYQPEDTPKYIEKYLKKLEKRSQRKRRTDLEVGMIVIILEGQYESKKAIYLGMSDNYTVICSGIKDVNGISLFKIDESYVFPTSTKIPVTPISIDHKDIPLVTRDKNAEIMEIESPEFTKVEIGLLKEIERVDFLKSYFATDFVIDSTKEFYSQKY